ncbi:CBN-RABN-5 protein [Caenorhabditis brenneri]|uniref:CBN-RABN-5 protein n=1 Tax=Caenorhabditis brenneri TaxID=135651 RepID=G0P3Z9_CAEBE|nr:CBN-RABN-5 protein [Caenorhabditis brenneri]
MTEASEELSLESKSHEPTKKVSQVSPTLQCEMCQNYEVNLTTMQENERKLNNEVKAAMELSERYQVDLSNERDYRKDLEKKMSELSTNCLNQVNEAAKTNAKQEKRLDELSEKHDKSIEVFTEQLNLAQVKLQQADDDFINLGKKYKKLLGATRKTAQELRSEKIDMPADIDQLQFICLKNREELIETRAAKEHTEQQLQDEITVLRAQIQEERAHREDQEVAFTAEISRLQSELGSVNSKMAVASVTIADQDSNIRQIRDLQMTVGELEAQVQQVQNERTAVEQTAQNYKQRCTSLQQELDTSEQVQRDFVKLSQSLQIQLEKIRQSEQEVRWQWDDDVHQCSNCETSLARVKAKPHCMHCGKIFCPSCLKDTVPSGPSHRPAPVCKVCHTLLNRDTKPFFATQDK